MLYLIIKIVLITVFYFLFKIKGEIMSVKTKKTETETGETATTIRNDRAINSISVMIAAKEEKLYSN